MPLILVEYLYDPPLTDEKLKADGEKVGPCLEVYGIRWVETFLSNDRRRRACIFEAPNAEMVRSAFHSAGIKFERAWRANRLAP
jgi:hypothetical protein